jgi:geranylgeranyl diphosphate synthase type II
VSAKPTKTSDLKELLASERKAIEAALERLLPPADRWPQRLHQAMRYAVFAGGKRIRPILARLAHCAAGGDLEQIVEAAAALELVHTYSLVHDDLPALDNDVLRRGQPTVHVAFDEATAILAGDALLTEGLLVLAHYPVGEEWDARRACASELVARALSSRGMAGGQMEDLEATGQVAAASVSSTDEERLHLIHRHKTGALLQASVELGAVLAGVDETTRQRFADFGERLGLAFQVADDILDATATAAELGKSPGKDAAAGKLTFVTLYGVEPARQRLRMLEKELLDVAHTLEGANGPLAALTSFIARRRS